MCIVLAGIVILILYSRSNKIAVKAVAAQAAANTTSIAQVKANQDLYRQQYLNYIKDMIDAMNKLQEDNRSIGLRVPKAPVPRPIQEKISETDLRRLPQLGPVPTPIVKTETKKIYIRVRPKPTPTILDRLFKPKSTR